MDLKDIKIGAPLVFKSSIYGDTAVHVTSIYNEVIHFSIDGGEASRQVRDFPELSDGMYFAIAARLWKRPTKARKTAGSFGMVPGRPEVKNTIREVPGVGKVAIITDDRPKMIHPVAEGYAAEKAKRKSRRLSFLKALDAADDMRSEFNWAQPGKVETF